MTMPTPPWEKNDQEPKRPAKVPLTRDRIVDAAYVVLDREGYHRMSMRQVAAELGVAVSALYAHVQNKEELFRLMYERMFVGNGLPEPDPANWIEQIKDFARLGRAKLRAHRDLAWISMMHVPFTPELMPNVEQLMAILRCGGLPDRVAAIAGDLLSTFLERVHPGGELLGAALRRPPRPRSGPRSWSRWRATSATCRRRTTRT